MIDAETHRMKHRPPSTLSSWSLVCKGTWHLNQDEESAVRTALDCFDQAIAEDADFSLGWNGRDCVYQKQLYRQWADDPRKTIVKLAEDAATCLRLEPRAAHGHASVGLGHILMGNRDAATTHLEQAVALNPSSSRALVLLAQAYGMSGRLDECIMLVEDLLRLDPVSASAYRYRCILAMSHLAAGRTDDAILWANGAIAANPRTANGYLPLIAALVEQGTPDDANAALEEMRRNDPSFDIGKHLDMMRPFTRPELLRHFVGNLATVGLTD
jgi:tetratricopeptide (TPR) repeat protein